MREITRARDWLKPVCQKMAEITRRLASEHYRNTRDEGGENPSGTPENYPFSYKMFVGPQLLFGVPFCTLEPVRRIENKATAEALELATNAWAKETSLEVTLEQLLDDCFVGFGVSKSGVEPRGDYAGDGLTAVEGNFEAEANYPFTVHVDPRNLIIDPEAKSMGKTRFVGQVFERDLEDVRNDDRYDPASRALVPDIERELDASVQAFPENEWAAEKLRKRINLYELYLPEHGLIVTLAETGKESAIVLRAEPYFGPDEGPYELWGFVSVPGELLPISPLVALWDEFLELNAHSCDMADSAATHKALGIGQTGSAEDAKTVKDAKNGDMILLSRGKDSVGNLEIGGATDTQMSFVMYLRDRLDRNLGYTDAQRGQATGRATATENTIAQSSADLRVETMRNRVRRAAVGVFRKVAWYFFHDPSIPPIELIRTDPITGMQDPGIFFPGPPPAEGGRFVQNTWLENEPDSNFIDYELEIDVKTMVRTDDAIEQKRAQDEWATLIMPLAATLGPQVINWRRAIDRYGNAFNTKNLSKIILNDPMMMLIPPDPLAMQTAQSQKLARPMSSPTTLPGLMNNAGTGMSGAPAAMGGSPPGGGGMPSATAPAASAGAK
jgi:hypothetical protein